MENNKITGNEPAGVVDGMYGADAMRSGNTGLTIRQQFAMAAMQGLISNAPGGHLGNYKEGCELALKWADQLIAELNK